MPLIVEDGTAKPDANSYVDLAEARELATLRGIELSADDAVLTGQLVSSADRIATYESQFTGSRKTGEQGVSYPRVGSYRYGSIISDTSIPRELKLAQVSLANIIEQGGAIWSSEVTGITRETVGPLTTEYAESFVESVGNPELPQIDAILRPLFAPLSFNFPVGR